MQARVPILTYHAVNEAAGSPLAVAPQDFAAQMQALARAGYRAVPLSALVDSLRGGQPNSLPGRAVVITFDDGYRSVLEAAAPVLRELGFAATLFLVAGMGGKMNGGWRPAWPMLSWDEAASLAEAGFELGAHTLTHPVLPHLPPAEAEREMLESKQEIAKRTGQTTRLLAYPYGARSWAVEALARRHFDGACGARLALAGPGSNLFDLERVDAFYLRPARVAARLDEPRARAYLAVRRAMRWARRLVRSDWA